MKIAVFEIESVCGSDLTPDCLKEVAQVHFHKRGTIEEVIRDVGDSEGLICSKIPLTAEVMDACPKLRYIGLTATGYNNVDLAAAKERGITVTNIPGYSTEAVAQQTLAFLLQFATNLISYDASVRRGDWQKSPLFCDLRYPMMELQGKTLGLFGLGNIGSKTAALAEAFGMRVIYHSRTKKDVPWEWVTKDTLFAESDFLSLHCPLTAETNELIQKETLSQMKKGAYLINTARGGLVCEKDVAEALQNGTLSGFAADVLTKEPMQEDCPLKGLDNCILTPHVAWAPRETRLRLLSILCRNVAAFEEGNPQNVVN